MNTMVFTGFPGFIAARLMERCAVEQMSLAAIVLPSQLQAAETRAQQIERATGCSPIRLLAGDITHKGLALKKEDTEYLQGQKLVFWHLAAVYDLAVDIKTARAVNVEGTKNVNDVVKSLGNVERYIYFSTAYVAGNREGRILEDELIRPEQFKNHYESTKFEAELLVDKLKADLPVTIIRPGIVRGHSNSGETSKFDGPYFFLNMIDRLNWLPVIPFIGRTDATINVVPVDYILEASIKLSQLDAAAGATVHLTDPNPHPVEEVYRMMVYEMTGAFPKGRIPKKLTALPLAIPSVRRFLGVEAETLDYLDWPATFDTQLAEKLLAGSGVECPDFLETLPSMVSFYQQHKKDISYRVRI